MPELELYACCEHCLHDEDGQCPDKKARGGHHYPCPEAPAPPEGKSCTVGTKKIRVKLRS